MLVFRCFCFALCLLTIVAGADPANKVLDKPFDQILAHRSVYSTEAAVGSFGSLPFSQPSSSIHLGPDKDCYVSLSEEGYIFQSTWVPSEKLALSNPYPTWSKLTESAGIELFLSSSKHDFYVLTANTIEGYTLSARCGDVEHVEVVYTSPGDFGTLQGFASSTSTLWVASETFGLQEITIASGVARSVPLRDPSITALFYCESWSKLFAGSRTVLYTFSAEAQQDGSLRVVEEYHEWVTGVIDHPPLAFAFDQPSDSLWLAERDAVHKRDRGGQWLRYGYHQGLPVGGNITSLSTADGFVWVGSDLGVAGFWGDMTPQALDTMTSSDASKDCAATDVTQGETGPWSWLYLQGQRYLPSDRVLGLVQARSESGQSVLAVTATGLAVLETQQWSLREKAAAFATFQYPRHDRRNLTSQVELRAYGDLSTYAKAVGDNDGLWTAMHGMGEAYNYAATGSKFGLETAWRAFEGLETLQIVTGGYPRFPARSFCYPPDGDIGCGTEGGEERWQQSTTMPGYLWKDDTSSDEVDGHLAALPVFYDLIATSAAEKQRILTVLEGLTLGIIENDYYLIDPSTGQRTTWGFWNPREINEMPQHYSERGANSLGMLAYLASAYSITRKPLYKECFLSLVTAHRYDLNSLNVKIDNPDDDNHSDNELISLTFHTLFYAWKRLDGEREPAFKAEVWGMVAPMLPAAQRTWAIIGAEMSPLWAGVYAGLIGLPVGPRQVQNSVWTLRRWAIDLINWPVSWVDRVDVETQPYTVRDHPDPLTRQIRPPMERTTHRWNADPFVLQDGDGGSEFEPAVWRLPYYMMVYYDLLEG